MPTPTATVAPPRIHVPDALEFGDEQFTPAPDLDELYAHILRRHPDVLGYLDGVQIAFLWRKKGGKKSGDPVMGKTVKPSGVTTAFTTADVVVWLAADNVFEAEYSDRQIEALLFHELNHIGIEEPTEDDEDGVRKVVLRGHDISAFKAELQLYGAWETMLIEAAEAFKQADLFDA